MLLATVGPPRGSIKPHLPLLVLQLRAALAGEVDETNVSITAIVAFLSRATHALRESTIALYCELELLDAWAEAWVRKPLFRGP